MRDTSVEEISIFCAVTGLGPYFTVDIFGALDAVGHLVCVSNPVVCLGVAVHQNPLETDAAHILVSTVWVTQQCLGFHVRAVLGFILQEEVVTTKAVLQIEAHFSAVSTKPATFSLQHKKPQVSKCGVCVGGAFSPVRCVVVVGNQLLVHFLA